MGNRFLRVLAMLAVITLFGAAPQTDSAQVDCLRQCGEDWNAADTACWDRYSGPSRLLRFVGVGVPVAIGTGAGLVVGGIPALVAGAIVGATAGYAGSTYVIGRLFGIERDRCRSAARQAWDACRSQNCRSVP